LKASRSNDERGENEKDELSASQSLLAETRLQ